MKRSFLLQVLLLTAILPLSAQNFPNFRIPERIVSPEMAGDTVIFRFAGEYVSDVRVEGSWSQTPVPMSLLSYQTNETSPLCEAWT